MKGITENDTTLMMTSLPSCKLEYSRMSKNMGYPLLIHLSLWILLFIGNNNSFICCLSAPKNSNGTRGRRTISPSTRKTKAQTISKSKPKPKRDTPISQSYEKERTVVILYNKPSDTITSHESQDSRLTVYEDIHSMRGFLSTSQSGGNHVETSFEENASITFKKATGIRSKLHAIGRLDADTTGLLLLTNDGRLVNYVTNPDAKILDHEHYTGRSDGTQEATHVINKTYEALIMGHHTEESLRPIRVGVDIGKNYVTKPLQNKDDLQVLEYPNHKSTVVSITIGEGKNRQVRKMFHAIGSGVMKLKRTRIGKDLTLEGLNEGEW
eukprot:CAMPEP_0116118580 /NCGR_PEP_ID=MMETSP0329-20121206/2179_1 /TAXON_ID=697910 /ORGANISM="Pseudo-nitzschia arenysensis, Strain B593" /LENGTH=324 /DNA_ID=CAMNT_0003612215 /DNA_START=105 /DNA_END=1076 /DNA_ORIENTATION=-